MKEALQVLLKIFKIRISRADNEGNIIMASPSAARMYGYNSPNEINYISTIFYYNNPEDRRYVLDELKKYGRIEGIESEHLRKDENCFFCIAKCPILL